MFNIEKFLAKFSKNINAVEINSQEILEAIERVAQIKLSVGDLEIKNNVIFVKSGGAVKNKIFIFKEKIIEEINKNIPVKIIDIR